jgi:hypothetical protein
MNCSQIDEFLDLGVNEAVLPASVELHLSECERCRRLVAVVRQPDRPIHVSEAVADRITGLMKQGLEPVMPVPASRTFGLLLIGGTVALCVAVTGLMGGHALAAMSLRQLAGSATILGGGAALLALLIGRQIIPASRQPAAPWLQGAVVFVVLVCGIAVLFPWSGTSSLSSTGLRCSIRGLMIAIFSGGLACWTIRRGVALQADLLGAMIGLLAGLAGVAALQFNCPILEAPHILVWHVGIVIVAATVGLLLGRLWNALQVGSRKR